MAKIKDLMIVIEEQIDKTDLSLFPMFAKTIENPNGRQSVVKQIADMFLKEGETSVNDCINLIENQLEEYEN